MDHISARGTSASVEIRTEWKQFWSLVSDLIPPRIRIDAIEEAEEVACTFTVSTALAYMLSTSKLTLSEINNEPPGVDHLLQLRKLWHETTVFSV
jgi:hypothetical protein